MNQSQKNFIGSYENMLSCFDEWGASLLEDIEELNNETSTEDYRNLEIGVNNYRSMGDILNVKPSTKGSNFVQIASILRQKQDYLEKDSSLLKLLSRFNIPEDKFKMFK